MNDETTTPREGGPDGSTPEEHLEVRAEAPAEDPTEGRVEEHDEERADGRVDEPQERPDGRAGELELDRREDESTQVLPQAQPTSELPTLTPEAPVTPEASGLPAASAAPTSASPAVDAAVPAAAPTAGAVAAPTAGGLVTVRTGPRPGAILLGLLCLLVAAYTTARQTLDWRLDLNLVGPISIGALGALLLLVGLIGLVSRRRS